MRLMVRDSLKYYSAGERTVFLDVSTGRYSLLVGTLSLVFQNWSNRTTLTNEGHRLLDRLVDREILVPVNDSAASGLLVGTDPSAPQHELQATTPSTRLSLFLSAILQRLIWHWRVRFWPLQRIMQAQERLERQSRLMKPSTMIGIDQIVRAHQYADFLLGNHDRCLERTLALAAICRKNGFDTEIVIAVQLSPFAAHAWVQNGGIILNERLDRARLFKPILAF